MSENILIADDSVNMRVILKDILHRSGYTVVGEAGDGAEAVSMFDKLVPDAALIDLAMVLLSLFTDPFPYNLFPVIALANYFLFFGKDVLNVIPMSWRANASRLFRKKPKQPKAKVIHFNAGSYEASTATPKAPYTHRCTICGRTDVTNPELEFRYCSKCKGYYCYCQDHINNHTHIQ